MTQKTKNPDRVRFSEKLGYLLVALGNIPLMNILATFFLIFYTDVVGLDPAKIATLFLIAKVVDGISDPIVGYFVDHIKAGKMGKFRPLLIFGTCAAVINYIFLWFGAVWSPVGKYAIVYITYLLLGWTFDCMDIPANSLLPVMTTQQKERNSLSFWKMLGLILGAAVISIVGPMIVASGTLDSYYTLIFGAMAVTLILTISGTLLVKERVKFTATANEKYGLKDLFGFIAMSPVLFTFVASILYGIGSQLGGGANTFFFTYIMGDLSIMSGVMGASMLGMLPGLIASQFIANKLGKKPVFVIGLVFAGFATAIRLIDTTSLPIIYISTILVGIGSGLQLPLMYSIQADNTNYVQYKTGKRAEGAIASLSSFIAKVGQGVAGALPGYILAWTGYVANAPTQTAAVNNGIIACVIVIPAILMVAGGLVFLFGYKVTKKDMEIIGEAILKAPEA